jgi:hypothetical protein
MRGIAASAARALPKSGLLLGAMLVAALLSACGHHQPGNTGDINVYPANYKSDILGAMHAYLDDPTGIRDAAISEPTIKTIRNTTRYMACLKFNGKRNGGHDYAGTKEIVAVFLLGKFDQFVENSKETCAGVTYAPFPELEKLPP